MKMYFSFYLLVALILLTFFSCAPPEVPGYIDIKTPLLIRGRDTLSGEIKDVWVFHGQTYHGTFQAPVKLPFINREISQFIFLPGVWANDAPVEKKIYPFMQPETLRKSLSEKEVLNYTPTFKYYDFDSTLEVPFEENFEDNAIKFINIWGGNDTALIRRSSLAYKGGFSGYVGFDSTRRTFAVTSAGAPFKLNRNGIDLWAEVTYRGNVKFSIGIDAGNTIIPGNEPPGNTWRTIYIDLSNSFNALKNSRQEFRLFLSVATSGENREIYFDNIRLLQFRP